MKINDIVTEACGKIVQGVNTTVDVKPGETERQAKKFFGGSGKPVQMESVDEAWGGATSSWEPIKGFKRFINRFKDTDNYELADRIMKTVIRQNPDISLTRAARKVASQFAANHIELDPERIVHNWQVRQGKGTKKISDIANMTEGSEITIDYDGNIMCEYDNSLLEAEYQGRKVELNKPMQGDVKKFKVYVKNDKGNVVKVNFGEKGAKIKKNNPERRKSFRARHNCDTAKDKTTARYWSCRKW